MEPGGLRSRGEQRERQGQSSSRDPRHLPLHCEVGKHLLKDTAVPFRSLWTAAQPAKSRWSSSGSPGRAGSAQRRLQKSVCCSAQRVLFCNAHAATGQICNPHQSKHPCRRLLTLCLLPSGYWQCMLTGPRPASKLAWRVQQQGSVPENAKQGKCIETKHTGLLEGCSSHCVTQVAKVPGRRSGAAIRRWPRRCGA